MQIKKNYAISLFLDTRRQKKQNKLYPVKLRVFCSQIKKAKLYSTKFEFENEKIFNSVWKTEKPRKIHEDLRLEMQAVINAANDAAREIENFSFEAFERILRLDVKEKDVFYYYDQQVFLYKRNQQISTANNYKLSAKSLKAFCRKNVLRFTEITPQWLKDYESFMLAEGKSSTTIGIYLRPLRAIFNTAIEEKTITSNVYPFGRRKYTIPAPKATKKALTKDQLKALFEATPQTPEQEKAKAFWFFSYSCNGLNFADIARLKYKNLSAETLSFQRQKTKNTNRTQAPINVFITDFAKQVIEQYGSKPESPESFIFEILKPKSTPEQQHRQIQNFVRFVNQHFKKFADNLNIPNVSTYTARHTFATNSIRQGATMEFVSEALGHSSLKTTKGYFAGFESETRKQFAEKLMQF
jgi:site-specific recombinase XerD